MSGQQKMSDDAMRTHCGNKTVTQYRAPTLGLEHVVFEYGERMKPGNYKTIIESIAEHMAGALKCGGP